ncbi:MAG: phosphopyruvate hydratase [bacterium]|nr:phosphopyruvate hydratase [bacterium]
MFKILIKNISAKEILDSRGNPTLEVSLWTENFCGVAAVPSGASTGKYEAAELRDGDKNRFNGLGVKKAIQNIEKIIAPKLNGMSVFDQVKIDNLMKKMDGTKNKSRLGGNAMLGVSLAVARAAAASKNQPLYKYLGNFFNVKPQMPRLYMNLINGGKHANNDLAFQEYHIVPETNDMEKALEFGTAVFRELKKAVIKKYGKLSANIGDEGGLVPDITDAEEPLKILWSIVKMSNVKCYLALDVAANSFYEKGKYIINNKKLKTEDLLNLYKNLIKRYPMVSIEDPFHEEDFDNFARLREFADKFKVKIVGDDLTVTNPERIKQAIKKGSISGIIIKPNQIGTLTEVIEAIKISQKNNITCIVSHRSGETNDDFISDLAVASGAFGIKAGAPIRGERVAKYNRLWEINRGLK